MIRSKPVFVLLTVCLFCRLIFFLTVQPWTPGVSDGIILQGDALEYHQLATTMIQYHQFAYEKDGPPDVMRTPLYPLFIGFIYLFQNPVRPWSILLIQIFIDTASCILLFLMLAKFLNRQVAFYAALFYALDPFFILYSVTLLSDILFVFLCILGASLFFKALARELESGSHFWLALSAFFFGLAALVRPVAQFIPLLMAFFLLLSLRKERKKALLMTCFFALFFLLTISPWMIRNLVQFNTPALSVVGEYDLTILYVQPMEMERRGQAFSKIRKSLLDEADQLMIRDGLDPQKMNDFQKGRYWKKLAFHYISRYPYSFLKHYLFGIAHTLGNLATGPYVEMLQLSKNTSKFSIKGHSSLVKLGKAWFQQKTWPEMGIGLIIGFYLLVTYTLSAIGVLTFWRKYRHQLLLWFSFILVFYFLFITGTAGLARYKLPAVPFYLPFVGLGLKHVLNRWFSTETGNLKN